MNFKKLMAYIGSFVFGGMPSVIELWITEKDVQERTTELYSERMAELNPPEDEGGDE